MAAEAAKNAPPVVGEPTRDELQAEVNKLQSQVSRLNEQVDNYKHRLQLKEEIITDPNAAPTTAESTTSRLRTTSIIG